jgi:20S proteasome alpha/beta subunit
MMRSPGYSSHSCLSTAAIFWLAIILLISENLSSNGLVFVAAATSAGSISANTATTAQQQQQQQQDSSSLSSYEAVRALDSYGDAVQLRHAQAAADVQGRLVIAMERDGDEIWIFSVPPVQGTDSKDAAAMPHYHRKSSKSGRNVGDNEDNSISSGYMVQQLSLGGVLTSTTTTTLPDETIAIVCTGIQADAVWLKRQLRAFCGSLWERYSIPNPSPVVMAQAVAFAKRLFWRYPLEKQWKMAIMASVMKSSDSSSGSSSWARPLGLRTLVLSSHQTPRMQVVEPSGIIRPIEQQPFGIVCMGKNSEAIQAHLEEKVVPKLSQLNPKQTQNAIFDALRHVLGPNATPNRILLETVSCNSIERQLISRS